MKIDREIKKSVFNKRGMNTAARSSQFPSAYTSPSLMTNAESQTIRMDEETTDRKRQATEIHTISSATSVFEVIKQRRSVGQMTDAQPTRVQIERLLEAATYAPNHHVTEPWHFFVLIGAARDRLGKVMEKSLRQRLPESVTPHAQEQLYRERTKPKRAPVVIIVALRDASHLAGELVENIEATAAAVQNMLLAATEMGLATIWRTGEAAHDPLIKQWLGLSLDDPIVAFLYVGYPRSARPERLPSPFVEKTTWLS